MTNEPIDLADALTRCGQLWSPRIVTRVNDYDVRIAKVAGEHVWHTHDHTDEFFLVLDGELRIALRDQHPGHGQRCRRAPVPGGERGEGVADRPRRRGCRGRVRAVGRVAEKSVSSF